MSNEYQTLIPNNGWIVDIDGLDTPHFHKLQGLSRKTGIMKIVDGATRKKFIFNDEVVDYGPITLVRARDNSAADKQITDWVKVAFKDGEKRNGSFVQYHRGQEVLRILFTGLTVSENTYGDFDTMASGDGARSDITVVCEVEHWEEA
jgi:hypothetical protein